MRPLDMDQFDVPRSLTTNSITSAIPPTIRHEFESSFGADLSQVKVHEGSAATLYGAKAFTTGNNIYFEPGAYEPHTDDGRKVLSHEIVHLVQQRSGVIL